MYKINKVAKNVAKYTLFVKQKKLKFIRKGIWLFQPCIVDLKITLNTFQGAFGKGFPKSETDYEHQAPFLEEIKNNEPPIIITASYTI